MSGSMSSPSLVRFQTYMRERPVRRAVFWVIGCFLLMTVVHLVQGREITLAGSLRELARWSVGGVLFYLLMRWWESSRAR